MKGIRIMLALTRKQMESIMINDNIEITIVEINRNKVRLAINAPKHIPVHRKEVYDAIKKQKQNQ